MATLAATPVAHTTRSDWLWQFLRDEFEPYPQRVQMVTRMVIASTLVMLICEAYPRALCLSRAGSRAFRFP